MRSWTTSLTLLLVSIAIGLLCLEAAARVIGGEPLLSTDNFVARDLNFLTVNSAAVYDPQVGWVQTANLKTADPGGSFTTGAYGVRMPTPEIRPLTQHAVLAIGDSFTAGSEVGDDGSWPAQLQGMLGRDVINAGVGGYGVDQMVLRAETLVPLLQPEVLIIGILAQDSLRNPMSVYGGAPKPYFTIEHDGLALHNDPVPRMPSTPHDIGWLRATLGYSYLARFAATRLGRINLWLGGHDYKYEYSNEDGVRVSCLLMPRLAALRDRFHLRIGVVMSYGGGETSDATPPWYGPPVNACAAGQGFPVVDTFPPLHAVFERDGLEAFRRLWVMHDDNRVFGHMSAAGNRLVASLIVKDLFDKDAAPENGQPR
ncbi:MAG TPA: GDSL-type esterase/lipase family protein [Candidatus Sulfotelmatobacter sp.]|nr:GDSL-type esterase/lipase family protein [Candidatus Sulfotelmatobacter sp.]